MSVGLLVAMVVGVSVGVSVDVSMAMSGIVDVSACVYLVEDVDVVVNVVVGEDFTVI